MIIVIADDFTGAAELGGIGLRYNLKVEVNTQVNLQSAADLLVIATDTRSTTKDDAVAEMGRVTEDVARLNPTLVFKKVDSVLRGYVTEELLVHINKLSLSRALLVPANPYLGRSVVDGVYLLNAQPLHHSNFANDPEFPAKTSSVIERLQDKGIKVFSQKHPETLQYEGIIVGDAANAYDLKAWAQKVNRNMLIAGAAGFFTALLDNLVIPEKQASQLKPIEISEPVLIVSGTAFGNSADAVKSLKQQGRPVSYMPVSVMDAEAPAEADYANWCNEIVGYITTFGKAIIAIDKASTMALTNQAKALRNKTAIVTDMVFKQIVINELMIEGGSTASAILNRLGISKLYPVAELSPGVIRMSVDGKPGLYITLKPGSYAWPDTVRQYTQY
jgi:uncharacterized protein YgbK (DUF1537 family)